MDPNLLLICHQLSLAMEEQGATPDQRRAHDQFLRDYGSLMQALPGRRGEVAGPLAGQKGRQE